MVQLGDNTKPQIDMSGMPKVFDKNLLPGLSIARGEEDYFTYFVQFQLRPNLVWVSNELSVGCSTLTYTVVHALYNSAQDRLM